MSDIFKLPVCPYCKAVVRYKEVKKTTHDKVIKCHYCKKEYAVSFIKGRIIFILIECILLVLINIFLLKQTKGITLPFLAIGTAVIILISTLFFPFTVRYKKIDTKSTIKNKDNKSKPKLKSKV